jgi:hypothetical protein
LKPFVIFILSYFLLCSENLFSQCNITSSNGWTVTVNITPKAIIPEFTNCPSYYHYEVRFDYTITFTGSTSGRNFNANAYFKCTGGTGGDIYYPLGNFTSNSSGTRTTSNNARQYSAPYSALNPTCTAVTLADANCTSVKLDYWGTNLSGSTINCNLSSSSLPIELFKFTAKLKDNHVLLDWSTASEQNNDFFTIEKSADGINWEAIGNMKGAGTTNIKQHYSFLDENAYQGLNYYRLKQTDYNKEFEYSYIIDLNTIQQKTDGLILYPNPADQTLSVYGVTEPQNVYLINQLGEYINSAVTNITSSRVQIDTKNLVNGIYFIEVNTSTERLTKKIIVKH